MNTIHEEKMAHTTEVKEAAAGAASTNTFGRVLCQARNHYFVVDGPVESGCPGEALNPGEVFLAGVAACAVEVVQLIGKREGIPLKDVDVNISGKQDPSRPIRRDLAVVNSLHIQFRMKGITEQEGQKLVEAFKGT